MIMGATDKTWDCHSNQMLEWFQARRAQYVYMLSYHPSADADSGVIVLEVATGGADQWCGAPQWDSCCLVALLP